MPSVPCKECKWWQEWKLPAGKTLHDMNKKKFPSGSKRGDCLNERSEKQSPYSSTTCDYAEAKEQ